MKTDHDPLKPRPPGGMGRGLVLALLVHGLLVVGLAIGVSWRASNPEGLQAELWAAVPQVAAPKAAAPDRPAPEPPPPPKPEPAKRAPPPKPAPEPEPEPPPVRKPVPDPKIAIEQAKREQREEREREARLEQERERKLEQERTRKAEALRKETERKEAAKKAELEKLARDKADQVEKTRLAQAKAEAEKKRKEEELQQAKLEKQREELEAKRLADAREATVKRMLSQAGGDEGEVGSKGTAARTAAPSDSYAGRVKGRIKPNIVFVDQLAANPEAEVLVRLAPDGRILSQKLVRSSGSREWDQAVQRAIDRTEILPRDTDGRVPGSLLIAFRPRE